jgi:hypothetical protein
MHHDVQQATSSRRRREHVPSEVKSWRLGTAPVEPRTGRPFAPDENNTIPDGPARQAVFLS